MASPSSQSDIVILKTPATLKLTSPKSGSQLLKTPLSFMVAKPITNEVIALTEKKINMTLDDIIKLSKTNVTKPKKQRISNRNQKFFKNDVQDKFAKVQRFMDTRSSLRQGALAQRRSNFQGNQFSLATEAARKAVIAPISNRAFNNSRPVNVNNPQNYEENRRQRCRSLFLVRALC